MIVAAGSASSQPIQVLPWLSEARILLSRPARFGQGRAHWSVPLSPYHSAASWRSAMLRLRTASTVTDGVSLPERRYRLALALSWPEHRGCAGPALPDAAAPSSAVCSWS